MVHITFDDGGETIDEFTKRKPRKNVSPFVEDRGHDQSGRTFSSNVKHSANGQNGGNKTHIFFDNDDQLNEQANKRQKNYPFKSYNQEENQFRGARPPTSGHLFFYKNGGMGKNEEDRHKQLCNSQQRKLKKVYKKIKKNKQGKKQAPVVKKQQWTYRYEENDMMTRYDGFWVQKVKVAELDRLKTSLEEQNLDAKTVS